MGLLTGKALEYAKSLVALLSLVLTALSTVLVGNQVLTTALVVVGAVGVWLVPNVKPVDKAMNDLERSVNRNSDVPQKLTVVTMDELNEEQNEQ